MIFKKRHLFNFYIENQADNQITEERVSSPQNLHNLINVVVGSLWAYYAFQSIKTVLQRWHLSWEYLLIPSALFFRNSALTILFLIRRPAKATSRQVKEWFFAILGTFIGYFYVAQKGTYYSLFPPQYEIIPYVLLITAVVLSIFSILSLGRSFGIVPANRGVQTGGLYALVRHPIYSSYIAFDLGLLSFRFSWHNFFVFCISVMALYLRATYEERLLFQDPGYQEYTKKTRYMFIPGLI